MRKGLENVLKNPGTKSGNYSSSLDDMGNLHVKLFGNQVAVINESRDCAVLSHCGWYTHTTACTIKSIISYFCLKEKNIVYED